MASSDGKPGGIFDHHVQTAVCDSRAKYREGRRPRAVKVYTINLESQYLLIQGVPAVGAMKELVERFALYGAIEQYNALDEYPAEDFTEVYLIKFVKLQSARIAKKKMDEQSFFGGLLHVCYAPEFETVEETRKKLEERKAYISRVTKNQDYYVTKKKPVPEQKGTKDSRQDFHAHMPGFCTPALNTSPKNPSENSSPCLPYSCEFPLCYFASKSPCSPGEHTDKASDSCNSARNRGELQKHRDHSAFPPKLQMNTYKTSVPCSSVQEAIATSQAVGRFMPRTTQLQERKRRRDCDRELGTFLETNISSNEVLIGPKLPGIPTVDLQDDSLNTTANLIRSKLKEVTSSVPKPPEDNGEDVCTSHPRKQRRRI
ncbi:similar to RIKEN cDNA C030048B08, isoform CRA_b [Rattus norvegicus]|uniref:RNA-binding protein 48 n=2 Tax=Rattus norvegicus TaxID=10116 RepID=RBM48_RAT|nr:RNA-binding protein 48 [Rattus norvegicus]Q561R3.1 RecName: Full=RNA-binding protein 48 [Rattus norvegicus]AAH93393.1 Similar to RIKEN cDNA C030048B08 [Rattus norvegicus]EDL84369.1 similar to RIKEN cDNA C030048B08, isoform CRA_b [Rattus norvegicus]|eukprot:NP_001019417.1 RNA-binding protein 48 [Rattus norvegicus]